MSEKKLKSSKEVIPMSVLKIPELFWEDSRWIEQHYSELVEKYPDQWIAVVNKRVIAHGKDRAKVKKTTMARKKRGDFPLVFIECGKPCLPNPIGSNSFSGRSRICFCHKNNEAFIELA